MLDGKCANKNDKDGEKWDAGTSAVVCLAGERFWSQRDQMDPKSEKRLGTPKPTAPLWCSWWLSA